MKSQTESIHHVPVMLEQVLAGLAIKPDGKYIDGTFGRGGHSRAILKALGPQGSLIGIDQDPLAVEAGQKLSAQDSRFQMIYGNFSELEAIVHQMDLVREIDGVMLDIGVSSPQLDEPERGFSFMQNGPLDMRMNPQAGISAAQWLAKAEEKEIADVLWRFGEEKQSRKIAKAIVAKRLEGPIETTLQLSSLIEQVMPGRREKKHPATRSFQAIRIYINQELSALESGLKATVNILKAKGRLVVISFHSLEDRIVKQMLRDWSRPRFVRRGLPELTDHICLSLVGKAQKASDEEIEHNIRARSAVLRVAERLA